MRNLKLTDIKQRALNKAYAYLNVSNRFVVFHLRASFAESDEALRLLK